MCQVDITTRNWPQIDLTSGNVTVSPTYSAVINVSFQYQTIENKNTMTIEGMADGNAILKNILMCDAPSISADSINTCGIVLKN